MYDGGHSHGGGDGGSHSHGGGGGWSCGPGILIGAVVLTLALMIFFNGAELLGQRTYDAIRHVHAARFVSYTDPLFLSIGFAEMVAVVGIVSLAIGILANTSLARRWGVFAIMLALVLGLVLIPWLERQAVASGRATPSYYRPW
jgi:hypothetical protein